MKSASSLDAGGIELPLLTATGAHPGPTLLVSAGVHGDEYEGIQAIFDVFESLDTAILSGTLIAVTVTNPPAFWAGTRTSPLDNANLARVFPGNPNGSPTEKIAWHFDQQLLAKADFYLDLHSAGVKWLMPTLIGYHAGDAGAQAAAEAFGAPVIWRHPEIAPGRTVSAAIARGIPTLYAEARGAGRIHRDDLNIYTRGIRRLMQHLNMLPGAPEPLPPALLLNGSGNIDSGIVATSPGFLSPCVEILDTVERGQPLGKLLDLHGRTLEHFNSPCAGRVVLIHACPLVAPAEPLFLIT